MIKAAFLVYNEWDGTWRPSKQLIVYTVIFWGSIMTYFFGWEPFDNTNVVAAATAIMSLLGSGLRIESKGGESFIKPEIRKKVKSLMPELPG